jgi:hypothetical protein
MMCACPDRDSTLQSDQIFVLHPDNGRIIRSFGQHSNQMDYAQSDYILKAKHIRIPTHATVLMVSNGSIIFLLVDAYVSVCT